MIVVRTPQNELFNYAECREMFEQYQDKIDVDDFDTVLKTTHFFSFYEWNKSLFIGCIYFYQQDRKLYVTAFSGRHHHKLNIECLKMSLDWYTCDVYAECKQRTAQLCLIECGFERVKRGLYVYRRNNNGQK